jgi:hypothetical protein
MKYFIIVYLIIISGCLNGYAQKPDTLYAKRVFLSTYLYKDEIKLSGRKLTKIFSTIKQSKIKYRWSNILKPIGPVVAISGVGLAYVALKGVNATATIEGQKVDYKVRSLPKLLIGLCLVIGGLSMVESSNELAQHAVDIYNTKLKSTHKISYIDKIQFGLTESNALGFTISLK